MNIRYFFIRDVAKRQHVTIDYCPKDEMIGGFFTKPVGEAKIPPLPQHYYEHQS